VYFKKELILQMLSVIEKVVFLQNVDIFSRVSTEQLAYVAAIAEEVSFLKGDVIFKEQDTSDALYLVIDGKVRLQRGEDEIAAAGSREAFGAWALFDDEPRLVTAVVAEDCRLLRVDRDDFADLLADHIQITQGIMKDIVGRLRGLIGQVASTAPGQQETGS
jgi:CRP/FNR family transcriptional regulator/CRP/FNR family cyclic AMP-dependent transcriptional regulator